MPDGGQFACALLRGGLIGENPYHRRAAAGQAGGQRPFAEERRSRPAALPVAAENGLVEGVRETPRLGRVLPVGAQKLRSARSADPAGRGAARRVHEMPPPWSSSLRERPPPGHSRGAAAEASASHPALQPERLPIPERRERRCPGSPRTAASSPPGPRSRTAQPWPAALRPHRWSLRRDRPRWVSSSTARPRHPPRIPSSRGTPSRPGQ